MPQPTLAQIQTEIDTDPKTLGYSTLWTQSNGAEAVANKMNEMGAANPDETLFKGYTPVEDMNAEIVLTEYNAWSALQRQGIDQFLRGNRIKTGSANMRTTLTGLVPVGASRTAMIAQCSRVCSRAEFLWGEGISVSPTEISDAQALP